jgi:heptosyltransferase II
MRILIVKLGALGDVVRTTSLLRPILARHPGARIDWITSQAALPLLAGNPYLEQVEALESALLEHYRDRYELVLSLEEHDRAAAFAQAACRGELVGIVAGKGRLGYTPSSAAYYDLSLLNPDQDGGHAKADGLKAANKLTYAGLWLKALKLPPSGDMRPILSLREEDRAAARALGLPPGRAIGLNPGAGRRWPAKQLGEKQAASLARALSSLGRPVLLLGGADEGERNARILSLAGGKAIDAGVDHPLRAFAGIVESCALLISTDSLAFHVATALSVPAVALVGPTSAAELDAFGRGEVVSAGKCECFYKPKCQVRASCLERLPEETVVAVARRWLK